MTWVVICFFDIIVLRLISGCTYISRMTTTDIDVALFPRGTGMDLIRAQHGLMNWLAPRIGVSQSAISVWKVIPAERARDIEEVTGIPRHLLRPDLWEPPWQLEPRRPLRRNNMSKHKKPQDAVA